MPKYLTKALTQFLAAPARPEGTLSFHEAQGFLFAIACAPEMIRPSEWLPLIFNEQDAQYADMDEGQSILQSLMDLYNIINTQVFTSNEVLPDDITIKATALDNVGEEAPLGRWSNGFLIGHEWLMEMWDHFTPEALDEELGSSLLILSFFSDRRLAEAYYQDIAESSGQTLDKFADNLLGMFEDAMHSYANLARSIQTALAKQDAPQTPYVREDKVGRNDPCPCGSGKKYKKCCGLH